MFTVWVCVSVSALLMHLCAEDGGSKLNTLEERCYVCLKRANVSKICLRFSQQLEIQCTKVCLCLFKRLLFVSFFFCFLFTCVTRLHFYITCGLHLFFPSRDRWKSTVMITPKIGHSFPHIIAHKFTDTHTRIPSRCSPIICTSCRKQFAFMLLLIPFRRKAVHDCWYAWRHGLKTIDAIASSFWQNWFSHYFRVWQHRRRFNLTFQRTFPFLE